MVNGLLGPKVLQTETESMSEWTDYKADPYLNRAQAPHCRCGVAHTDKKIGSWHPLPSATLFRKSKNYVNFAGKVILYNFAMHRL